MRVLAVDPGQRVGMAEFTVAPTRFELGRVDVMPLRDAALRIAYDQALGKDIELETGGKRFDVLVVETWRLTKDKAPKLVGDDMQASQLIGAIRLIAWLTDTKIFWVPPTGKTIAQRAGGVDLARLKEGFNEEHSKDAVDLAYNYWFTQWFDPTYDPA